VYVYVYVCVCVCVLERDLVCVRVCVFVRARTHACVRWYMEWLYMRAYVRAHVRKCGSRVFACVSDRNRERQEGEERGGEGVDGGEVGLRE